MGPKKDAKKELVEEPPKEEKLPQPYQLQGCGKYQYINGTIYEGAFIINNNIKQKHGFGTLTFPSSKLDYNERYQGSWVKDNMQGYGKYYYASGAIYSGDWKNNKHQGKGIYIFPNGSKYDGQWSNHLMNGYGIYYDFQGNQWKGQFRNGNFSSQIQKQLVKHKQKNLLKQEIKKQSLNYIKTLEKALEQNSFENYFYSKQVIRPYVSIQPINLNAFSIQNWKQIINCLKEGNVHVLQKISDSKMLSPKSILKNQLEGKGQIVQITINRQNKKYQAVILNLSYDQWTLIKLNF